MLNTFDMNDMNTQAIRELTTEVDGVKKKIAGIKGGGLPDIANADRGKTLKVKSNKNEAHWVAVPEVPTPAVADEGKVLGVNDQGKYALVEGGGGGSDLPEPTIADNMKALVVDEDGEWSIGTAGYKVSEETLFEGSDLVFSDMTIDEETYHASELPSDFDIEALYDALTDGYKVTCTISIHGQTRSGEINYDSSQYIGLYIDGNERFYFYLDGEDTPYLISTVSALDEIDDLAIISKEIQNTEDFELAVKKSMENSVLKYVEQNIQVPYTAIASNSSEIIEVSLSTPIQIQNGKILTVYPTAIPSTPYLKISNFDYDSANNTFVIEFYNTDSSQKIINSLNIGILYTGELTSQ